MRLFAAFLFCALCAIGSAQEWALKKLEASPRHQEWVAIEHGNRKVMTFVVYPEVKEKAPVIILIHEIFGMTDWVRNLADQFAAAGYIAVAPDLLSGMGPNGGRTDSIEASKVGEAIQALPSDQITGDLNAVADYAKTIPAGNFKIAVAGFCWGGTQAWRFATNRLDLSYALAFYGTAPNKEDELSKIVAPVYGFYGENDMRVNATVPGTTEKMSKLGKFFEATTYPGAGHGFMRAGEAPNASDENAKARSAAWDKVLALLAKLR
jgi:carboxymethylenebutenolidase